MIAIIDYGAGNIKSLQFALTRQNLDSQLTADPETIRKSDAVILPGVGAFKDAMDSLNSLGLTTVIKEAAKTGKPILGICLGMQLFYDTSEEDGRWQGLGLLEGKVGRISNTVKVPHMGWNTLRQHAPSPLLEDITDNTYVYFVHSYAVKDYQEETLISSTEYGGIVPAIVQKDNIIGMQFHPEKSGSAGLKLLQNFRRMIS
ncbi:imidazole glycerol phosphate synthase subunit HisH [Lentibacillus sediminis]|uniref:imidazole glycerol phosphate synthase subunit HisH n=1 Tax=Lentibacillus sediminis TaxID=1940529 RepID=UPI000C1BC24B|nr:imidazole glycerol phosphate synthase subunit HisH [Lentibacillus sediminis]